MNAAAFTPALRALYYGLLRVYCAGGRVECPICGIRLRRFRRAGRDRSSPLGSLCPNCRSFERHRLLWLFLRGRTDFFSGRAKRVLHVAPEACLKDRFKKLGHIDLVISDVRSGNPGEAIDITAIPLDRDSVDAVICCHVLEHIPDDLKAMKELRRVLKPGGWAVLNVPVDYARETTDEDPAITEPARRLERFGLEDHVRIYGRDYPARLRKAGFIVDEIDYVQQLGPEFARKFVLMEDERIYYCTKTA